jgi:hypothetical protein
MRDYDPTTGRYLQADPLGLVDGASVYGYVRQSPMMLTDPTGECPMCAWLLLGAVEGVAIGYLLDLAIGDGCYTWGEFWFDATLGAILGPLGNYGNALKGVRAGANPKGFAKFLADEGGAIRNSAALRAALKAAGHTPGVKDAAHHVVASGAKVAQPARDALAQAGVGINSALNGVFVDAARHSRMHTNAYYEAVNEAFRNVSTPEGALSALSDLASDIIAGRL